MDPSSIPPWEWPATISDMSNETLDIQHSMIEFVISGGLGTDTWKLVKLLYAKFPKHVRLSVKYQKGLSLSQKTCSGRRWASYNSDKDLYIACSK